jgi:CDP-diacylglycerol---glycerol-3-phosphate 3-phosphatidyltransferase
MHIENNPKKLNTPLAGPDAPTSTPVPHAIDELTFNTTPNILTLIRIVLVPMIVTLLFLREPRWDLIAALIFAAASITDYFDGYLARTQKIETIYGKLLDPLADKFLVASSLITLQYLNRIHPVVVILLICRELAITGLRALASAEGVIISASSSGKWKTALQMVAIGFIMAESSLFGLPLYPIGMVLLYLSLAMSLWSAKDYIVGFFKGLREARRLKTKEKQLAREARRKARVARFESKAKGTKSLS